MLHIEKPPLMLRRFASSSTSRATLAQTLFPQAVAPELLVGAAANPKAYFVPKTLRKNWPVYTLYRRNTVFTEVRKVLGNVAQFKRDLLRALPQVADAKTVRIVAPLNRIEVRGNFAKEIRQLLDQELGKQ